MHMYVYQFRLLLKMLLISLPKNLQKLRVYNSKYIGEK